MRTSQLCRRKDLSMSHRNTISIERLPSGNIVLTQGGQIFVISAEDLQTVANVLVDYASNADDFKLDRIDRRRNDRGQV